MFVVRVRVNPNPIPNPNPILSYIFRQIDFKCSHLKSLVNKIYSYMQQNTHFENNIFYILNKNVL